MRTVFFSFRSCRGPAVLLAMSVLLAACGGDGGGGGGDDGDGGNTPPDTTPETFTFAPRTDVAPDLYYLSDAVNITGIDAAASIGIAGNDGAECAYAIGDSEFTTDAGTVSDGQAVRVQTRTATAYETARQCTLTVGGVTADFVVTTGSNDFAFDIRPGTLALEWDGFAGISRYELTRHNAATGESVFVAEDIAADAAAFSMPLSAHLPDWINDRFTLSACNDSGCVTLPAHDAVLTQALSAQAITYAKASNTGSDDAFGFSVALDGDTMAVGAYREDSDATDVDGEQANDGTVDSGAVYVFQRDADGAWTQVAYLKASNTGADDWFGYSVELEGDTLAVSANLEDSDATGNQADNNAENSGAVYVFQRDENGAWAQAAYLKASNTDTNDRFGYSVALDGDTLAVGAVTEDSAANGDQADNNALDSGAVYVFQRDTAGVWMQAAYLKASNTDAGDQFGYSVALDSNTLAVGAIFESSAVNGDQADNNASNSGAVYVFRRDTDGAWTQTAYLKASNTDAGDQFGRNVAVDGGTLAIGAIHEDSAVNDEQADNNASNSGAVYVFQRDTDGDWAQVAYLKASNTDAGDQFGYSVALDSNTLAVGAYRERSATTGVNGDQADNSAFGSGAVYVFQRDTDGAWTQTAYLKASNTDVGDQFGNNVAVDGGTLAVGATSEDSAATGVNGDQTDDCGTTDTNCASSSGAVYIF